MQVVTGTMPQATMFAKFLRSTPAENEIGNSGPTAWRNTSVSVSVITCSGGPDRYITFSLCGKKSRWLTTSSVLENFAPNDRPRDSASSVSRPHIADRLVEHAARSCTPIGFTTSSRVAQHVVQQMLEPFLAEHRRVHLHDRVDAHLGEQEFADPLDLVGRAAVERGERDAAAQVRRVVEVAQRARAAAESDRAAARRSASRRSCRR